MSNPIKPTIKTEFVPVIFIAASIIASFYFYAHFPKRVATHWDINGNINGYSSRGFAAFFFPALTLGMYLLFFVFPYLDPKKERYQDFAKVYHIFKGLIVLFLTLIYGIMAAVALGYQIDINLAMPLLMGLLFMVLGNYMAKIKSNWFVGIRTPWTLSDENIWRKTHQLAGKLYITAGIISILSTIMPQARTITFWIFLGSISIASVIPILYSLVLFYQKKGSQPSGGPDQGTSM